VRRETGKWKDPGPRGAGQAVLDFLFATNVARLVPAREDAWSAASDWDLRERGEREEERRVEAEELGAEGTPSFLTLAERR